MFTGIVTDIGTVTQLEQRGDLRARIATNFDPATIDLGASIACDGVCLTVIAMGTDNGQNWFDVEVSAESVSKTKIASIKGGWVEGGKVNLERALKLGDELGGHLVSGHVDGLAQIANMVDDGDSTRITFDVPPPLARFIAEKGSVTLNGTSLTVNDVTPTQFDVNLIPHTKTNTTWGTAQVGDDINLEIDTLARYVARLIEMRDI